MNECAHPEGGGRFTREKAEEIRLRSLYRREALRGGLGLPPEALRKLLGPDTAYHLYGIIDTLRKTGGKK